MRNPPLVLCRGDARSPAVHIPERRRVRRGVLLRGLGVLAAADPEGSACGARRPAAVALSPPRRKPQLEPVGGLEGARAGAREARRALGSLVPRAAGPRALAQTSPHARRGRRGRGGAARPPP